MWQFDIIFTLASVNTTSTHSWDRQCSTFGQCRTHMWEQTQITSPWWAHIEQISIKKYVRSLFCSFHHTACKYLLHSVQIWNKFIIERRWLAYTRQQDLLSVHKTLIGQCWPKRLLEVRFRQMSMLAKFLQEEQMYLKRWWLFQVVRVSASTTHLKLQQTLVFFEKMASGYYSMTAFSL